MLLYCKFSKYFQNPRDSCVPKWMKHLTTGTQYFILILSEYLLSLKILDYTKCWTLIFDYLEGSLSPCLFHALVDGYILNILVCILWRNNISFYLWKKKRNSHPNMISHETTLIQNEDQMTSSQIWYSNVKLLANSIKKSCSIQCF